MTGSDCRTERKQWADEQRGAGGIEHIGKTFDKDGDNGTELKGVPSSKDVRSMCPECTRKSVWIEKLCVRHWYKCTKKDGLDSWKMMSFVVLYNLLLCQKNILNFWENCSIV